MISKRFWQILFTVYIILLFCIVVIKFTGNANVLIERIKSIQENREMGIWNANLRPFDGSMMYYLKNLSSGYALYNIAGNIVPFMPLGFLMPIISRNKGFFRNTAYCIIVILAIEVFQFITLLGFFDINDVILNTFGCVIGYGIMFIMSKLMRKENKNANIS